MKTHSIPRQARDGEQSRTILALAIIALLAGTAAEAKYSGGTGEPNDPYQIGSAGDLLALAADTNDYGKCFILTADIDLDPNLPGGQVFTTAIIAPDMDNSNYDFDGTAFTGRFDGNGHKITHFTINGGNNWWIGLFGYINPGGSVNNLGLENFAVSGYDAVGGLVGFNYSGTLTSCYATGSVSGNYDVGGLVGINAGTVSSCYATGDVNGQDYYVGGLVGYNGVSGHVSSCYAASSVSGTRVVGGLVGFNDVVGHISSCYAAGPVSGTGTVGGLVGRNERWGTITTCYATGTVTATDEFIGGLAGINDGTLSSCYATGNVIGQDCVGGLVGLVGFMGSGPVNNCYATGDVNGRDNVGGLVGQIGLQILGTSGTISSCYAAGSVSGDYSVGGLVGNIYSGSVNNCYATGSARGANSVGGLIGYNRSGMVSSCYATGSVSGVGNVGGLVGYNDHDGHVSSCYAAGSVSGTYTVGGLVGASIPGSINSSFWDVNTSGWATSAGGTGKTTEEMKTLSTFTSAGWDFVEIWGIGENQTYPFLLTEPAGDLNHDKKVDFEDLAILALHWLEGTGP